MGIEVPNSMHAAAIVGVAPDGKVTLHAANGVARVEVEGGHSWRQRIGYRLRRWLRMPPPRQTLVWHLLGAPLAPDEAMPIVIAEPGEIRVEATMGTAGDHVTTITEGAWPSRINVTVMRLALGRMGGTD